MEFPYNLPFKRFRHIRRTLLRMESVLYGGANKIPGVIFSGSSDI